MTRARRSLAVMANGQHPYINCSLEAVLSRDLDPAMRQEAGDSLRYQLPDMELVDLSFAGRLMDWNPALQAIARAKVGDPIQLVHEGQNWVIKNMAGRTIGRMRKSYRPPDGYHVQIIKIGAILRWRKADNAEKFREVIKRDEWETVLPDIVFESRRHPT